ncbi:FecR domain-containing protein [Luteolibacter marinus]|uniref:FecR domain-containing protein n=1 Tax=Luteolibacter marinus TaxID=2776705 RepID=UPI0018692CE9|nr:FecR family protein [Luteolibacter marinus]
MEEHELNRLLNRLIDGSIEADDFDRIQAVLKQDEAARRTYYELLGVDMLLGELYEVPDYIAVHSQTMDNSWALRRAKRGMFAWSALGAAAILLITLGTFFLFKARPPEIKIAASEDSHFHVNGEIRSGGMLNPDDSLVIDHGVVSLALGPYVEAYIDGPARLRLIDRQGRLELMEGSAFFQIAPGGGGFEVHTPAGIIRDIGTKFGVRILAGGQVETHVTAGAVEVERHQGDAPYRVDAGEAVKWSPTGPIRRTIINADLFVQALPWQHVLFRDDFNEEDGTLLSGKNPDVGWPWRILMEPSPTLVTDGRVDTSFGPRTISGNFIAEPSSGRRRVYLVSLTTLPPEKIDDKVGLANGRETITLWNRDGFPLVSLTANATDRHRWHLSDDRTGTASLGTQLSALEENTMTLSYDRDTGLVRLYEGGNTRGTLLDQLSVQSGESPVSFTVTNADGGDVAIDDVDVRVVAYPQASRLGSDGE